MLRGPELEQLLMTERWYVQTDDTIGGCVIANRPKDVSELDYRANECTVASFLSPVAARHIVELHNATLPDRP